MPGRDTELLAMKWIKWVFTREILNAHMVNVNSIMLNTLSWESALLVDISQFGMYVCVCVCM
jgi:hypothetical protein